MLDRIKRRLNDGSIKTRLLLTLVIISLASTGLTTAYSYDRDYELYLQQSKNHLITTAQGARRVVPRGYYSKVEQDPSRSEEIRQVSRDLKDFATKAKVDRILAVEKIDGDFRTVASDEPEFELFGIHDVNPEALRALQDAFDTGEPQIAIFRDGTSSERMSYFSPISRQKGPPVVVIVDMANAELRSALHAQLMLKVAIGFMAFVILFGLQLTLVDELVKPIDDFSEFSERLAKNGFKQAAE